MEKENTPATAEEKRQAFFAEVLERTAKQMADPFNPARPSFIRRNGATFPVNAVLEVLAMVWFSESPPSAGPLDYNFSAGNFEKCLEDIRSFADISAEELPYIKALEKKAAGQ